MRIQLLSDLHFEFHRDNGRSFVESLDPDGVDVLVQLNFVAYDGVGNNPDGVTAYLQHILSFNSGERLKGGGGGKPASEVFGGYIGLPSDVDPTAGAGSSAGVADLL